MFENFNINAQILYRTIFDFQDIDSISDPLIKGIATRSAAASNQQYQEQTGMSIRPSYKLLNETLEIEIAYVSWFKNKDSLLGPKRTYAFSDNIKGIIGGEFYQGSSDSVLGQFSSVSSGFFEFRYLF